MARRGGAVVVGALVCTFLPVLVWLQGAASFRLVLTDGRLHLGAPRLHVLGNRLVDSSGRPVVLRGVNRSGTEYMCLHGHAVFDGPSGQASVTAMKAWGINAVRVPLNEACWDGDRYVRPALAGARYQGTVERYVRLLNANGIVAIIDLHWSDGAYGHCRWQAVCQKPMPDANAIRFWKTVAGAFSGNDAVIFDLFNEPFPGGVVGDGAAGWRCWLHGGRSCPGFSYQVAGMQSLVNAVRSTGADNVIMVGGLSWGNNLAQWLKYEPLDPDHNLAASWHSYNFNGCHARACWVSQIAPVIARVPLIAGEIGESDCSDTYITPLLSWLDARSASYLAWAWDAWASRCGRGPTLITGYDGSPTRYGAGYKAHLLAVSFRRLG